MGLLLDGMTGGHFEVLEAIEREVDAIDERALRREPTDILLDGLVGLRRRIGILRRSLTAQREVYAALARPVGDEGSPIGAPWPALTERLERAIDATERARELLVGSFDIVMTRTGQRTNDIMRVLTVISSVLLPSVVIAGAMGMNFHPAFFDDPALFYVVVAAMLGLGGVILMVTRLRHWIYDRTAATSRLDGESGQRSTTWGGTTRTTASQWGRASGGRAGRAYRARHQWLGMGRRRRLP